MYNSRLNNKLPHISIIIPTYNRANFIGTAIESVLAQKYDNFSLLIIDDRSTDNTEQVVSTFSQTDSRVCYLRNEFSQGPAGARNYGIENSKGDYIAFLDSDDLWIKGHLMRSIDVLEGDPSIGVHYGNKLIVDSSTGHTVNFFDLIDLENRFEKHEKFLHVFIIRHNIIVSFLHSYPIVMPAMVLRRSDLGTIRFNEKLFLSEDLDFCIRLFLETGQSVSFSVVPSVKLLRHKGNISKSNTENDIVFCRNHVSLFAMYLREYNLGDRDRVSAEKIILEEKRKLVYYLRLSGSFKEAISLIIALRGNKPLMFLIVELIKTIVKWFLACFTKMR